MAGVNAPPSLAGEAQAGHESDDDVLGREKPRTPDMRRVLRVWSAGLLLLVF